MSEFKAPHPGTQSMPRWTTGELIDAPTFTWRNWLAMLGPGLVMGSAAIGGGEWLAGPSVTARYGGALMWLALVSIICQGIYNIEISRYTLYSGEPIFTGKFRTMPGPVLWIGVYLILDFGSFFPYLAASAATPVQVILLNGELPDPDNVASHWWTNKWIATAIFVLAIVPLVFGGKVYNTLKIIMSVKLVLVISFLLILGVLFTQFSTWTDITSGFFRFGTMPILHDEDMNGNGVLDPGEDWDSDGRLDVVEKKTEDGFEDVDNDGKRDGENVANIFTWLFTKGEIPPLDFTHIAMIAALAAIAGNGGLSNTPISNFTRDQGWGMGHHVGAIPSMVGGHGISLSHEGCVFEVTDESLPRWKRWYRHVVRDQMFVWVPACVIGVALPSMLSVQFLDRGVEVDKWNTAVMTAGGVREQVTTPQEGVLVDRLGLTGILSGENMGQFFWSLTLLCGFLVLAPSVSSTVDGVIRRWVDVFWTASPKLRELKPEFIRQVYFGVLVGYMLIGLVMLWLNKPTQLLMIATIGYNFALGISCWHTLIVNRVLLPKQLRPGWVPFIGLIVGGIFFMLLGTIATMKVFGLV